MQKQDSYLSLTAVIIMLLVADDVNNDLNSLLNAWNYDYKNEHSGYASYFKSAVLHQQIGTKYPFDNSKREAVSQNHISTIVSSSNSYNNDAKSFFKENIGLEIDIPPLPGSQIITYAGIKIKDDAVIGMTTARHRFHVSETETVNVDCYDFSNTYEYLNTKYYKGETYEAFTINLYETSLLIILPNSGVNISSINVSEAYQSFLLNNTRDILTGYVPYFHIKNEEVDLTDSLTRKFTGKESFYSKLLSDDVKNDLKVSAVLQSSDFEFNEKGISGESVTEIGMDGSSEGGGTPQAREIYVNRPFYAISLKDDFPVFVSRVDNPSI